LVRDTDEAVLRDIVEYTSHPVVRNRSVRGHFYRINNWKEGKLIGKVMFKICPAKENVYNDKIIFSKT